MQWLGWAADQHVWAVIFAIAASMLLPWPLLAAQRPGRGIKPWWTTSRFLAWIGLLAGVFALATGEFIANKMGLLNGEWILRGEWTDLRIHQYFGGATVFLGSLCLRSAYMKRKEHQGLGFLTLTTGLLWAVAAGGAGVSGIKLAREGPNAAAKLSAKSSSDGSTEDDALDGTDVTLNQRNRLMRILDYTSLVPMHQEPVRSPAHKNRWVRVWVSQDAADAYATGGQLPNGALVVMNSVEDRWGNPTHEIGPLYTLEAFQDGSQKVGMYWSFVPESKRDEVGGLKRVSWREPNETLASCAECHANGMALPSQRRRNRPRRPDSETTSQAPSQDQNQIIGQ